MCPKGSLQPFVEGTQPKSAVLVTASEMEALGAEERAISVSVELPEGFYEEVVAEVTSQVLKALAEGGSTSADSKAEK